MFKAINETNNNGKKNSVNRLSNVIEDVDNEELLKKSDLQINANLDEDSESNRIIQNQNEYEYKVPLFVDDEIQSPNRNNHIASSKSNQNIKNNYSNNSITKVKFSSDYSINNHKNIDQLEPLLNKDNDSKNKFKITHVKDPKKVLDQSDDDKYFIDEKGLIIQKSNSSQNNKTTVTREKVEKMSETDSKAVQFKYNKDTKSLEVSINIRGNSSSKENGCFTQLKCLSFYQALFAEFLGTYLIVLFVCSFGLAISNPDDFPPDINGCLGSGLVVSSVVWCLGHVGGANFNPAVSIALLLTGRSNLIRVIFYIAFQLLGSTLATLTLLELVPDHLYRANSKLADDLIISNFTTNEPSRIERDLNSQINSTRKIILNPIEETLSSTIGLTLLNDQITPLQGYFIEVIITFILVFSVFACIDKRRNDLNGSFPLTIGFAVTVGALFGGKFTGGSMNPARSFGPAFVMQNWSYHWIYWAGPITGAVIAGFAYNILVIKEKYIVKK